MKQEMTVFEFLIEFKHSLCLSFWNNSQRKYTLALN